MPKRKTPAARKILQGNFRRDKDADALVLPGEPEPPLWLDTDARNVWDDVVENLRAIPDLLTPVDAFSLGRYCNDWIEFWTLLGVVQTEGHTIESAAGNLYQHPAVGARNKAAERLSKFESRFGMTPSDRVGLRVDKPKQGVRGRRA